MTARSSLVLGRRAPALRGEFPENDATTTARGM